MNRYQLAAAASGLLVLWSSGSNYAVAQTHVVHAPETVVRAVGVYEWTGEETKPAASRFVPITLFVNGQLEDAGEYLARPVPLALDRGTIFELQRAGVPQGTLELSFARHLAAGNTPGDPAITEGWLGFGAFKSTTPVLSAKVEKSGPISPIVVSGGKSRPSFSNAPASTKPVETPSTSTTTDNSVDPNHPTLTRKPQKPSSDPDTQADSAGSDSDRPTMTRHTDSGTAAPAPTATTPVPDADRPTINRSGADSSKTVNTDSTKSTADSTKTPDDSSTENDPERPTLRRRTEAQRQAARAEHDSSKVTGGGSSLNDDPDRPNLHRGKAPGNLDEDDLPALVGEPAGMQQEVGVSDAARRSEHPFARAWEDEAEHASVLSQMQAAARAQLALYAGSAAPPATPRPTTSQAARRTGTASHKAKPAAAGDAALSHEDLRGYTLSYGGAATYVYTASSLDANGGTRYVLLVAQREPTGALKVAMNNVTDGKHLDRTPRFELVDAVDAEASNRASLLFELRAQNTRQFALYRVIGAQAEQTFITGTTP